MRGQLGTGKDIKTGNDRKEEKRKDRIREWRRNDKEGDKDIVEEKNTGSSKEWQREG